MKLRTIALLSSALVVSLLLAGCANSAPMGDMSTGGNSADSKTSDVNDADLNFAMNMVAHHTQAIEMADVVLRKDDIDAGVVKLALSIKDAQGPEIDTLESWLESWGSAGMSGMDHGMGETMSEDDMSALSAATGSEAARLFLEQMAVHHQGAIAMAQTEIEDGENVDAIALAQKIVVDQTSEIALIQKLLTTF